MQDDLFPSAARSMEGGFYYITVLSGFVYPWRRLCSIVHRHGASLFPSLMSGQWLNGVTESASPSAEYRLQEENKTTALAFRIRWAAIDVSGEKQRRAVVVVGTRRPHRHRRLASIHQLGLGEGIDAWAMKGVKQKKEKVNTTRFTGRLGSVCNKRGARPLVSHVFVRPNLSSQMDKSFMSR